MQLSKLGREHGLMLIKDDPDFLRCCNRCEVASSLGSVDQCPQRVFTQNSCCPSCSMFIDHGKEAMLAHWGKDTQFFGAIQIVIPLTVSEEVIRSAFKLHKVNKDALRIQYMWKNWSFDVSFEKRVNWVAIVQSMYLPLDLEEDFLRDPLIFGLAGFPERAGANLYTQLNRVMSDLYEWIAENYRFDPEDVFNTNSERTATYYAGYFIRFENQDIDNLAIDILAPDYVKSRDPEQCIIRTGVDQIPVLTYQKIREILIMQKGVEAAWQGIRPGLEAMLDELDIITTEINFNLHQLSELLNRVQGIQGQFLKIKPVITNIRGSISSVIQILSDPVIRELIPGFNMDLVNNWLNFSSSVERSVEGASSFLSSKLNLLSLQQEKKVTKRLNILTALFGSLSGFNLILAFVSWLDPNPTLFSAFLLGSVILGLTALTLLFVFKAMPED